MIETPDGVHIAPEAMAQIDRMRESDPEAGRCFEKVLRVLAQARDAFARGDYVTFDEAVMAVAKKAGMDISEVTEIGGDSGDSR